jgi:vitamin B12 transporter
MLNFFKILSIFTFFSYSILAQDVERYDTESPGKDSIFTDEITVETNRIRMTKILAPNKIQVLDEKMLSSINGSRLPDALELSDALFIKDYGFNSGIKIISLNATQSEHTLILIDGIRLNSRQNAQVDLSLYDLDNASRIEISKGGSSALYGSEAIGGVINIITKNDNLLKPIGVNFKVDFGSYGLRKFFGKISHKLSKDIAYDLSYSDERAKNNYEYNFKNGLNETPRERVNADFNTQAFNMNIRFIPESRSSLKLFTSYSHFERGAPGVDLGYTTAIARQIDYNSIVSLAYTKELSKKLKLNADVSYKYQLEKYFDPATFNFTTVINSFYKLNSVTGSNSISYNPSNIFGMESGYEISFNNIRSNETENGELVQGAVFTAAKFEINSEVISKITFYPSVRYDYFSNIEQKNVVTGKLGLNIKPFTSADFSLKSSIGNNFSAPTFNELYWKDLGNKDLKPERSISFDAGLFYSFKAGAINEFEFSYYNTTTTDRIVWTPSIGIWRPINIGKVKSEGIDISLRSGFILHKNYNASVSLNYSNGSAIKKNEDFPGDPSYGKQLIYLPKEMIKAAFMFNYLTTTKTLKFVSFNVFYRFTTRRFMNFENTVFAPRYDVLDVNFGLGLNVFNSELGFKMVFNNLLNEDYQVISGYPMPLRNYKIEINYKY